MTAEPPPPAEIAGLIEMLGLDGALKLIEDHGGTRVWVPKTFDSAGPFAEALGAAAAKALVARYGGGCYKPPLLKAWRIRLYRARGMNYREIARALRTTEKTVWRHLSDAPVTDQLTLGFDIPPTRVGNGT